MGKETIMLSKPYKKESQLIFPCRVTEKFDGVPVDFYNDGVTIEARSRQGEQIKSCDHIRRDLLKLDLPIGAHVIGEMYLEGMDFKDISGIIRRQYTDEESEKLVLHIFDYYEENFIQDDYITRMSDLAGRVYGDTDTKLLEKCLVVTGAQANNLEGFNTIIENFNKTRPEAEGVIIRAFYGDKSVFKSGWRSPGMLKLKTTLTEDLRIESVEEAIDKHGNPKGMVGRINVHYKDTVIGVGPGKLKHSERIDMFENQRNYVGKTIEVSYMPDKSYDALREARFFRFRPDKD